MSPLFSLHSPLFAYLEPMDSAPFIIRRDSSGSVSADESEQPLLFVQSDITFSELHSKIAAYTQEGNIPLEFIVARDELNHPVGYLSFMRFLELVVEVVDNQAVLLQTLLDTMSEATTIVDDKNQVLYWNEAAEKIYQIPRQDVTGTSLDNYFASESIRLKIALAEGTSVQRLYHEPRPNTHVLINSAPIRKGENGQIIGALSIEQDITELVRLHQELTDTTAHLQSLQQEMSRYQATDDPFYAIKGHSAAIQMAIQSAKKVAQTDATVLIHGESGVGKELFAQAIHKASRRADRPFIAINCAAIPAALFESELFGYQGGAFTGAEKRGKPGKLELAHEGTLFLDEIGELPLELQAKLLRALQERQFYRVGGTEPITVNTRIVAATNRQLEQMVAENSFREDLYYRLNVFSLEIPSLRDRVEDIPELVQIFLQEYSNANEQPVPRLATEVMQALLEYSWPGNIRQLRNVIERLSILQEGGVVLFEHLPLSIRSQLSTQPVHSNGAAAIPSPGQPTVTTLDEQEKVQIMETLQRTYGNKKAAAELLGISRGTLYNKLRKYGINPD